MNERVIYLDDNEAHLLLESLAGLMARSGLPDEVQATFHLAQRIEGFEVNGRPGAKRIPEIPMATQNQDRYPASEEDARP